MQMEPERPIPPEDDTLTDQERLDEAMIESFPASDPPSWNAGLSHEQAHAAGDALAARFPWARNWNETKSRLKQKFRQLTDDGLFYQEGKEDEVLTLLQKKLGMTREEIESILTKCGGN
ncbi:MAG TPA: CsbD family protein [Prosthecobacter sp.]|jgi:uncharacterized protein YjbJ (UPF0337 family)|nr:CsbD family protein [Prosthecobacter sp.]